MPTTAHVSRQLLCKGIAVCPYRHKSSQNFKYHFWPSPTGTSHPRKTWNRPLLKEQRRWNRILLSASPGLAPLLSPSHWPSAVAFTAPSEASPVAEKWSWNIQPFWLSFQSKLIQTICLILRLSQTHDKDILNPPFFFLLGFVFSSQNEKELFYLWGFMFHYFIGIDFSYTEPSLFQTWNLSSLHIATGVYFLSSFPGHSFSF